MTHDEHASGPPDAATRLADFRSFRERMNKRILEADNLEIRRFFALDDRAYQDGALDRRTKELLGLVASLVLRCDDCISYHMIRCREEGVTEAELFETLSVGLVVGGSIVIPHLRRAVALMDELESPSEAEAATPPEATTPAPPTGS